LQLQGWSFSPAILNKIVQTAGRSKSFAEAAALLEINAEFTISGRYVNELARIIGQELQEARDERTENHVHHRRPALTGAVPTKVATSVDGGRMNTRQPGQGQGVHDPGWREDKVGCLQIVQCPTFAADPHPEPPRCFLDKEHVTKLVKDLHQQKGLRPYDADEPKANQPLDAAEAVPPPSLAEGTAPAAAPAAKAADEPAAALALLLTAAIVPLPSGETAAATACQEPIQEQLPANDPAWPPKRVQRTCIASLQNSHEFGKMLAAEAYERNFFAASERAFLGDGLAYNWTIQAKWFADFTGILDFVHPLSYLFASAGVVCPGGQEHWQTYVRWMTACWQGKVLQVLEELRGEQSKLHERLGEPPKKMKANDPREIMRRTINYLENNTTRMNYPDYRRRGLPITSVAVESLIKEFNLRVKGTEKFWNDPEGGEPILQIRAGVLSEDDRLKKYILNRLGNPYRRHTKMKNRIIKAAA
jgi:hypothetical protein